MRTTGIRGTTHVNNIWQLKPKVLPKKLPVPSALPNTPRKISWIDTIWNAFVEGLAEIGKHYPPNL